MKIVQGDILYIVNNPVSPNVHKLRIYMIQGIDFPYLADITLYVSELLGMKFNKDGYIVINKEALHKAEDIKEQISERLFNINGCIIAKEL